MEERICKRSRYEATGVFEDEENSAFKYTTMTSLASPTVLWLQKYKQQQQQPNKTTKQNKKPPPTLNNSMGRLR